MTQESWDCVSVLLIENRLPEDTPLFVSCSLSCSLYCCCQKHEGWQWWTLSETTRDQHLCSSDNSKFQKAKTKRSTHALYTGRPTFLGLACVFYFLNPSKLHLWSKIHCRFSPITTISNLSCTWSRRSDSRGKLHLCEGFQNSASSCLAVWSGITWHGVVSADSIHICCSKRPLCGSPIRQ